MVRFFWNHDLAGKPDIETKLFEFVRRCDSHKHIDDPNKLFDQILKTSREYNKING
jgi:hypothetical protein